jgi:copper chaperone CopZ
MKKTVTIEGMSCGHCVMHVQKALQGVRGVTKADVDLSKAEAVVEGEGFTDEQLKAAVDEAGYKAVRVAS